MADLHVDLYYCRADLADPEAIGKLVGQVASTLNMQVLDGPRSMYYNGGAKPEDHGVTAFAVIAESHIAIHTFAARGFVQASISSCRALDHVAIIDLLQAALKAPTYRAWPLDRGLDHAIRNDLANVQTVANGHREG